MQGSITTVARELAGNKLDLVGVQKVRWDKGGTVREGDCIVFYGKPSTGNRRFCTQQNSISS